MANQSEQWNAVTSSILQTDEQKKSLENWRISISFSWGGGEWDKQISSMTVNMSLTDQADMMRAKGSSEDEFMHKHLSKYYQMSCTLWHTQ